MFSIPRPSRRHLLVGGAVGALALAATAVLPSPNAMAATGCAVTYTTNSWPGGFTATVAVKNLGDPVSNWTLGFTFPDGGQRVVQGWSATWQQSGSSVTARSADYNGALGTGASTTVGFNGSWTGSNPNPTSFTLNGTVCTGGTGTPWLLYTSDAADEARRLKSSTR
ncbi:cellulose binding domain-containing protein, partial [Micromonospora sp. R42004]|uniref:cellulose binding domain-containing protein n=1 Tax=Micromonospora sp. R42004 TaxID=2929777 RepID=UPI0035A98DAD